MSEELDTDWYKTLMFATVSVLFSMSTPMNCNLLFIPLIPEAQSASAQACLDAIEHCLDAVFPCVTKMCL